MDDLQGLEQWLVAQRQKSEASASVSKKQAIRAKVFAEVWGEVKRRRKQHQSVRGGTDDTGR